jgi:multisubunit Na+/H+ antiporter MnhF subunit
VKPLAVLIGIVMGSAVSLAVGLLMTMIVILMIPEHADRLAAEKTPLVEAILLFTLLSAAAAASFYGEIRLRRWRFPAHFALVAVLSAAFWIYWPR